MLKIINPANQEVLRELPQDDIVSITTKRAAAHAAQLLWQEQPFSARATIISRFRDLLVERVDELAATLTSEMGKPLGQARGEINATPQRIDFFLAHTESMLATQTIADDQQISYEALGVIANISAWNYPYFVGVNVFIPALLTGNAVLYKPSEHATLTGLAIAAMLTEAGLPEGLFVPIIGGGEVGAWLLEQPIDGVFFTGSYGTGYKVAAAAAKQLIPCQLELGGKDPIYVCEDAPLPNTAAAVADGAFYNAGQSCCAVERIYVHQDIYESFVKDFCETVKGFQVGDPTVEGTYIGPLFRESQLAHLEAQLEDAKAKGARILCGGHRIEGKGNYFAPTVVVDVTQDMDLMQEESFGPVIGIMCVVDDTHALASMNDTKYGLTAGVYTPDRERAMGLLRKVDAGSAYWNCCDRVRPGLPWSGRKQSGLGVTLSHLGIRPFLQPKAWHLVAP